MKVTTKQVLIGIGIAAIITGGVLGVRAWTKNKDKRDLKKAEGDIEKGGSDANKGTDAQTKGDIGKRINVHPTLGYTNVRSSAKVENGTLGSWFGIFNIHVPDGNLISKVTGNPIGVITEALTGDDGFPWYKVKLSKPVGSNVYGYVRQDAISF